MKTIDPSLAGSRFRFLRKLENLRIIDVSEEVGISKNHVALIEKGAVAASYDKIAMLAQFYGVSLDKLIFAKEEEFKAHLEEEGIL